MGCDLNRNCNVINFIQFETLEDEDDLDGEPTDGKDSYNDYHHPGHPFLATETLARGPGARNTFPEAEQHSKVEETNEEEGKGIGREHED